MRKIALEAQHWKTKDDFYDEFFKAVGAPPWHGRNFNALRDSIGNGRINNIEVPYTIRISGAEKAPAEIKQFVKDFSDLIKELHNQGVKVSVEENGE